MSLRQRRPVTRDPKYLAYIRTLPCCICGNNIQTEAAHIRTANGKNRQHSMTDYPKTRYQPREDATGQFGFVGDWARICVCGHELGVHGGEAPHECFNEDRNNMPRFEGELTGIAAEPCGCRRFRPSRRKTP